jgi:hypothetical protein
MAIWKTGQSVTMTRLREKSAVLDYIDSAHRGAVDNGCRSIHMQSQRELLLCKSVSRDTTRQLSKSHGRYQPTACRSDMRVTG